MEIQKKILIVDDDDRNVFAMKATLNRHGFKCMSASSAEQCLQIFKVQQDIYCVLMDMRLPEIDGYETIHIIKKDPALKNLPVVAVTARAMREDRELCLLAGANAYVTKPVGVNILLNVLKDF